MRKALATALILALSFVAAGASPLSGNEQKIAFFTGGVRIAANGLPSLTPGTAQPGSGNIWALTAAPAQQGTSSDPGYNQSVIAGWVPGGMAPFALISSETALCVDAMAANGISGVQIAADGGSYIPAKVTAVSTPNGYSSTTNLYCVKVNPALYNDGEHIFRAIVTPNSGYPRVLQEGFIANLVTDTPIVSTGAHGQTPTATGSIPNRPIVAQATAGGFTQGTAYYMASGGFTGSSMSFMTTATFPSAVTVTTGTPATFNQTSHGLSVGSPVTFSINANPITWPTNGTTALNYSTTYWACGTITTGTYNLATTKANALASTCDVSITSAGTCNSGSACVAWPVINPTATTTASFLYGDASTSGRDKTMAEAMYWTTNNNGSIHVNSQYVDGSGSYTGRSGSSSNTVATIHAAMVNLLNAGASFSKGPGTNNASCAMFTSVANHNYSAGDAIDFSSGNQVADTNLGANFTLLPWMTSLSNQSYYVLNNSDFGLKTFEVSLLPGGPCIAYDSVPTSGISVTADLGNQNIYLTCPGACSTPSGYTLGGSETANHSAKSGYLNILPAPGTPLNNVALSGVGANVGIRTDRVHFGVNKIEPVITMTSISDSPATTTPVAATVTFDPTANSAALSKMNSLFGNGNTWELVSGTDTSGVNCASEGKSGGAPLALVQNNITSAPNTVTGDIAIADSAFADCPIGSTYTFTDSALIGTGTDVWWSDSSIIGGTNYQGVIWPPTNWIGGRYATNVTMDTNNGGLSFSTYVFNSNVTHQSGVVYSKSNEVIGSQGSYVGENANFLLTTVAGYNSGSPTTLYFGAGNLPANMAAGWVILSAGTCNGVGADGHGTHITGYNKAAGTVTLDPATPVLAGCVAATAINLADGFHTDFWGLNSVSAHVNQFVDNVKTGTYVNGEIVFEQSGPLIDIGVANSLLTSPANVSNGYPHTITLSNSVNGIFLNNTIGSTYLTSNVIAPIIDTYMIGNTCAQSGHPFSSQTGTFTGLHVSGGDGSC